MSRHLGDAIHELVDGRLRGEKALAALAHLDACAECAATFREVKAARDAVSSSQCGIDMRFAQRLLDKEHMAQIAASEPVRAVKAVKPRSKAPLAMTFSFVLVVVVMVGVAYVAGAPTPVSLEFAESRAGGTVSVASVDTQEMRSGEQLTSWVHPDFESSDLIPVEAKVVRDSGGEFILLATVLDGMEPITVIQQHGSLVDSFVADLPVANVETTTVYVVQSEPSPVVVWEAGDVVVALTCECALATLEAVAEQFPCPNPPGFVERIQAGLDQVSSALNQ